MDRNFTEYCPDCVSEMKLDLKKLGKRSNWKVCPSCGFRSVPESLNQRIRERFEQEDNLRRLDLKLKRESSNNYFKRML